MPYVGNPLADAFSSREKQDLTGQSGTSFTLTHAVSHANDLSVYINHVRQEPTTAYSVNGTTLTTTGSVASTDDFYIIYDELAVQSISHPTDQALTATSGTFTSGLVGTTATFSGAVSGTTGTFSGALSANADTDTTNTIGRALIHSPTNDVATFSHVDKTALQDYALLQSPNGTTYINASSGMAINFNINNSNKCSINANGFAGTLTTAAQPNITSVGTLTSLSVNSIGATSVANISINSQGSYLGNYRAIGWGGTSNGNTHIYSQYNTVDDLVLHGGTGKGIIFESGGSSADRMVLDSNGNLGMSINTPTSHTGWQPKLHIKHESPSPAIILEDTTHSSDNAQASIGYTGTGLYLDVGGHSSSNNLYIRTSTNAGAMGNPRFEVNVNGEIRMNDVYDDTTSNSANMYIHSDGTHQLMRSTSSERFKKDIETLEDKYADAILGLRPVWYKSKCEKDNPNHSHWGLIAEEVAKIDPRLVTYRYETSTYKQNETTKELELVTTKLDEPLVESVQYDRLVPHLINICKRQEERIKALESK